MEPTGVALLAGDPSVVSGLEKFMFHEPGVFIQLLDSIFANKIMLVWDRSEP